MTFEIIILCLAFLHIFGAGSRNGLILIFDSRVLRIWCLQLPQRQIHSTSLNTCWHQNWDLCSKTLKNEKYFQNCKRRLCKYFPKQFCPSCRKNKDIIRDISSCLPRKGKFQSNSRKSFLENNGVSNEVPKIKCVWQVMVFL